MARPAAILIVGPNWVGDMVMAEPLARWLATFYDAPVDVLAPPTTAEVAARFASVREVIGLPFSPHRPELRARHALAQRLEGRYTAAYVLPGSWISALVPFLAGIPERVGYLREMRIGLLNRIVGMPRGSRRHTATNYGRMAGLTGPGMPALRVDVAQQDRLLAVHGLAREGFVAVAPGAEGGSAKRWPADYFAALATALLASGERVVLLGSARDAAVTAAIHAAVPGALDLAGRTSLGEAIDLIAAARVVVANDSGMLHIAAAVGTPVTGIFGPTAPEETAPQGAFVESVWNPPACSPCHGKTCPLGHHQCMRAITPAEVLARLAPLRSTVQ